MRVLAVLAMAGLLLLRSAPVQAMDPPAPSSPAASQGQQPTPRAAPAPPVITSAAAARRVLHDAVSANDLPRFVLALAAARAFADGMPIGPARNTLRRALLIYGDLQTIWAFAVSSPAGSFYDEERLPGVHDHLSADYPGYAAFIDALKISDDSDRTLYPTAETRAFLLRQLPKDGATAISTKAPRGRNSSMMKHAPKANPKKQAVPAPPSHH